MGCDIKGILYRRNDSRKRNSVKYMLLRTVNDGKIIDLTGWSLIKVILIAIKR